MVGRPPWAPCGGVRARSGKRCCEIVYVVRAFKVCGPTTWEWVGNYEGVKATVGGGVVEI